MVNPDGGLPNCNLPLIEDKLGNKSRNERNPEISARKL